MVDRERKEGEKETVWGIQGGRGERERKTAC